MKVNPQKKNIEKKYPKASEIVRVGSMVIAGAATATTLLGFVWYSNIPGIKDIRNDYSLSEIFHEKGILYINGNKDQAVNYTTYEYSDAEYTNAAYTDKGRLFAWGISAVRFADITADKLTEDEYIASILDDYEMLNVTGGCLLLPKSDDGYFVAMPAQKKPDPYGTSYTGAVSTNIDSYEWLKFIE